MIRNVNSCWFALVMLACSRPDGVGSDHDKGSDPGSRSSDAGRQDAAGGGAPDPHNKEQGAPAIKQIGKECTPEMRRVEAGQYQLGFRTGEPGVNDALPPTAHTISSPLCIDVHEVTVQDYEECVKAKNCQPPKASSGCTYGSSLRRHPVTCVTLQQASTYCASRNKRLPNELEWESAARGVSGTSGVFSKGDSVLAVQDSRRYCLNRGPSEATCPVEDVPEEGGNALRGMSGNVQEWTSSTLCPEDNCKRFVIVRGGYWEQFLYEQVSFSRRYTRRPDDPSEHVGFRCVAEP